MFRKNESPYQLAAKKMADLQRIKPTQLASIPGIDMEQYANELSYLSAFLVRSVARRQLSGNGQSLFLNTFETRLHKFFDMNQFVTRAADYDEVLGNDFETSAKHLSVKFAEFVGHPNDERVLNLSEMSCLFSLRHYDEMMLQLTISSAMEGYF